jgi:hypothetical protein
LTPYLGFAMLFTGMVMSYYMKADLGGMEGFVRPAAA